MALGARASGQQRVERVATKGRIRQSIAYWCVEKYWSVEETCRIAKELGCRSVELVEPKDWPILKKHGLTCALANSHWFDKGMNNPKYHEMCLSKIRESIDACAEFGFPNVITFTGFAEDIPPEALRSDDPRKAIPPLYGALLKNEQDVHLFEQLVFLDRRSGHQ